MPDKKRVIALGFFDGVHAGHAALMEMTRRRAAEKGAIPTVITKASSPASIRFIQIHPFRSTFPAKLEEKRVYGVRR